MILKFLKIFKQKKLFFAAVLTMIAAGLFFPGGNAHADLLESVGGFVMDIIAPIIYLIFYIFFYIAYMVAWIGASVINMTLNPAIINTVLDQSPGSPLYQGWTIFRDIANLFFILILLFIAIGTIVRSQSYNLKSLLPKLIIAVFLINFSNVIAGAIIDFGNIFMYGVLKWMCVGNTNKCFTDFYAQLMEGIDILFWKYPITAISFDFKDAAAIAIAAIYTFIYGLVLMALGVFLVIRIAAFAILIILSPLLAFTGEVFPGLQELSSKWWKNLINYTLFGPIFALLLYVSGLMTQNTIAVDPAVFETNQNLSGMAQNITLILTNIIPLIFLLAIIPITKELGIAGANAVLSNTVGLGTKLAGGIMNRTLAKGNFIPGSSYIGKGARYVDKKLFGGRVGGGYGRVKDWANQTRLGKGVGWVEKKAFGETKTLGQYKGMVARTLSPELWKRSIAKWLKDEEGEAYKIPLGTKPDEKKRIEKGEVYKKYKERKDAGLFENPEVAADEATTAYLEKERHLFEYILKNDLAVKNKQYKFLASLNNKMGLTGTPNAYSEDEKGWAKFLNEYKKIAGDNDASVFGQIVGSLAKKEGNWTADNIAYYENGENKIRDLSDPAEYDIYAEKNAEEMSKKSIGNKWNNMSADNFVVNINAGVAGAAPVYRLKDQGVKYINKHISAAEIDKGVQKGEREELVKIKEGLDFVIANHVLFAATFTTPEARAKANALEVKLNSVI